jgi:hypothetical protein
LSVLVAFTWSVTGLAFGFTGMPLLTQSVAVLVTCQVVTTLLFCCQKETAPAPAIERYRKGIVGLSFATMLVVLLLAKPQVKGAVIEEQLRRISKDPDPDPKMFQRAQALISTANSDGIVLPPSPIQDIVDRRLRKEDVFKSVVDKVNGEAAARGLPTPTIGVIIRKDAGMMILEGISGEGINIELFKPPGPVNLAPPDMVAFVGPIGSKVTSPTLPGAGIISILGEGQRILTPLDNLHCKHVIFSECILTYSGAALKLENVAFYKCQLRFGNNVTCQKLAAELLGGPSVTLSVA